MKITVKDCMELAVLKDSVLIGGAAGLDRRVRAVTVLETDRLEAPMKGDELVLTSFWGTDGDLERQCDVLRSFHSGGEAGVILFSAAQLGEKERKRLCEAADELSLPLILIVSENRQGLYYSDVINGIMEKALYGETFSNRLISNTIYHLLNFEKHSSFQAAAREAAINNNFQIVLLTEDFNQVFTVETQHRATIDDAIRRGIERGVEKNQAYTMINVEGVLTYWGPVLISGVKYYLMLVDNEDSYSQAEITKLAEVLELAMGMWRYSPQRDITAEFIKALRRGNTSLAYRLKEEAEFSEEKVETVFVVSGLEKDAGFKAIGPFEQKTGRKVVKIAEAEELCGVVFSAERREGREERDLIGAEGLWADLEEAGADTIFYVGGLTGIEAAADAYQLINEAWPFIQHIFPYKKTFTKYELALASNCINISLKGGPVKKNYTDLIGPLRSAGENKGRQLLETLEIFVLDAGMNTAKTARMMNLHTNTVQYRLKRIKEILGVDITGNTIVPGLMVALALERIDKKVRPF